MNVVATALRELYGLFVDDLAYAIAIAAWIVVAVLFVRFVDAGIRGPLLFSGFAVILIASVVRASK
jgi:hypothetical protein